MTTEEKKYVSAEEYSRVHADYWRVVRESEGFDMEDIVIPPSMSGTITGLIPFDCQDGGYPFKDLVKHYGMVGLHRYNMLMETNYQLASLIKFNMTQNCVCSYYITLFAYDPAVRSSLCLHISAQTIQRQEFVKLNVINVVNAVNSEGLQRCSFVLETLRVDCFDNVDKCLPHFSTVI